MLEERSTNTKKSKSCGFPISIRYPSGGDTKVKDNSLYGFMKPDVCEDYEFGARLDAKVVTNPPTQYDSEHVLEFQLPGQLSAQLDIDLDYFDHPDPSITRKLTFCEYVNEHWSRPALAIPGLETARGVGAALTPANHVAQQFPTNLWKTEEYVLLEHEINTPAKGKAWERFPLDDAK